MSACENLPQELLMAIVDNLRDDKKSLEAFSLVCKAWTNPARDHLFASLGISNFNNRLEKMRAANVTSIYGPFLRELVLSPRGNPVTFWHDVIPFLANFSTPRLRSLVLHAFWWHSLSPQERSAFLRRFESITFLQVNLDNQDPSNDIATIICSLPQLRRALLLPSSFQCVSSGQSPLSPELRLPERFSTLSIYHYDGDYRFFMDWLGSIPGPLLIHTLQLRLGDPCPEDRHLVNRLLNALGPSLKRFRCDNNKHLSIELTYNTHLRHIDLCVKAPDDDVPYVSTVTSSLSRMGSRRLEQVIFRCNPSWSDRSSSITEWNKVDAILDEPQFAQLKDVCICPGWRPHDLAELSALFATLLPTCHARGIISFAQSLPWEEIWLS